MNIISSAYDFEFGNVDADTNVLLTWGIDNQASVVKYKFLIDVHDLCGGNLCVLDHVKWGPVLDPAYSDSQQNTTYWRNRKTEQNSLFCKFCSVFIYL